MWQTGTPQLVRALNRRLVFNLIRAGGEISRAAMVELTQLSKATVSAVVEELMGLGLVVEGAVGRGGIGRRPIPLRIDPAGPFLGGLRIGPEEIRAALVDLRGTIAEELGVPCRPANGESAIRAALEALSELRARAAAAGRALLGAGIGVPGILNPLGDVVLRAPSLGWRDVSLRRILGSASGLPVWVNDEAKMAALAEATVGAGREAEVLLYLDLGPSVGAGLVRRGRLFGGTYAGHLTVLPEGPVCWCGNRGCLEAVIGECLGRPAPSGPAVKEAPALLAESGRWLGVAAADLLVLYQPELVLLGGSLGREETVLAAVEGEVKRRVMAALAGPVRILRAAFGEEGVVIGAAMAVLDGVLGPAPPDLS